MYQLKIVRHKYPLYIVVVFLMVFTWLAIFKPSVDLGIYVNDSPSEPRGIYKKVELTEIKPGDFVIVEVPDNARPYVYGRHWAKEGTPLLKEVGAVEGDRYAIIEQGFYINGNNVGFVSTQDFNGLPLPTVGQGDHAVSNGHFLAISTYNKNSFDSRYMGEIPVKNIKAKVVPWLLY